MNYCPCLKKGCTHCILEDKRPIIDPKVIEKTMANKNNGDQGSGGEEFKDQNIKYVLSKHEYDLYHEEDDVPAKVIRVKRFTLPNKGERWKIFEDNKVVYTLEGSKLTIKEREFLHTVDGINFLITQYKQGIASFSALKNENKKALTPVKE